MIGSNTPAGGQNVSRQQKRFGRTRNKILSAARTVFTEKGLVAATIDEIAERADVGRGSVYYHFENKDELIRQLIESLLAELSERTEQACSSQEDIESTLDAMIKSHIEFFSNRWEDFVLYYQGRADLTLLQSYQGIERSFIGYLKTIERLVDRVVSAPIPEDKLRRLACAIAGFISGYYSFASVASLGQDIDKEFMSLRKAFVTSLARFAREALPDSQVKW
jgi:AcrR family transcriptional regulator